MKTILKHGPTILLMIIFAFTACRKNDTLPSNAAPSADVGKNTTLILPANSILLDGSASADRDNNIVSYLWKLISGPSVVTIPDPASITTKVENLAKGIYEFELTVIDKYGLTSRNSIKVTVFDLKDFSINRVTDTVVQMPYNIALLNVTVNNFNSPTFNWKKLSGPNSFNIAFTNSAHTPVTFHEDGTYQFEITVADYLNTTLKDTMTISVLPDKNIYTAEKIFSNIFWQDDQMGYSFTINNISSIIPPGHAVKVYVKWDLNTDWQLVAPDDGQVSNELAGYYSYRYNINDNDIKVYFTYDPLGGGGGDFASDSSVKIVY